MKTLRYFQTGSSKTDPGDDPRDPNFVPLEQRSSMDRMRWWARRGRRVDSRPQQGMFDPPDRK